MNGVGVLAIIPARGGSKGLPRKNLRLLAGYPLLAWTIAAGRAAAQVDTVLVSTDDADIADVARRFGADVPFLRPAELARDDTPDLPVFEHALRWLERERGWVPELVVQLRPTSPFRPLGMVDQTVSLLRARPGADSVRTVTHPAQTPFKMWRHDGGLLAPLLGSFEEELFNAPRQRLPPVFWQTGHVDVTRPATILEKRTMTGRRIVPYVVDPRYAVDIDTLEQLELAEWLLARDTVTLTRPEASRRCA
jgi:N-acylneuraminate cytidylyltransferase